MSKARDKHEQRRHELALFGKDLTRRSGSRCEICAIDGVALSIYEVAPVPSSPEFSHCLFVCASCREQIEQPKRRNSDHWRCLNTSIWSEIDALKVLSAYMLAQLAANTEWAVDLQEQLYLEPQQQMWLDQLSK